MITQAYIMGALGKAAFQQDGKWYILQADEPTLVRPWHPFDNNLFSLSDPEILEVSAPQSIDQLSQLLQIETTKQEALTLALQLMDTSIEHPDLKQRIAVMLGEYAQVETVAQFLENRLLSTPVPDSFQPGFASNLCRSMQQQRMAALYDLLAQHGEDLDAIHIAWVKVAKKNFDSNELADTAYTLLVEEGHLAALTRALVSRSAKAWDDAVFNAALAYKKQGIASDARLFAAIKAELAGHFDARTNAASLDAKSSITEEIERIIETYLEDLQAQRSGKRSRKDIAKMMRQHSRRGRASGHVEFTNVDGLQKNLDFNIQKITQALFADNLLQAWQLVRHIIESQIGKSDPKHICKSLCNIAAPAAEIGKYEFARQLLHYALMLNDNDVVVFTQKAEIFKSEGKLSEAKAEYLQIKNRFPDNVVAQTGYAEVLKTEGRLSEAKTEYLQIKNLFPDNVVAQNGYAEILKSEGKLSEAKAEYFQIKNRFPQDVVAQNSYADILKSEGKLSEAKAEYLQIKNRFPQDVVAQNGYAEILKSEGKLSEAKAEYLQIKNRFPDNVVTQNGYAEILKSEGKLSEAKAEYLQIKNRFPQDVVAQTGYAEILKSEGKLSEAKAEYLQIKNRFPDNVVAQTGYAEILKSEGKLSEAKAEYLQIKNRFPDNVVAQNGYAEILKSEGKLNEAKAEYLQIKNRFPDNVVAQNGYAEILKSEGKLSEAKAEYLQIKNRFPDNVVAQTGYAEVLKSEGKLSEAKDEYEEILRKYPSNDITRHAYFTLLLLMGLSTENAPEVPMHPQTERDFFWVSFHINRLLRVTEWQEALRLNELALSTCNFANSQKIFKRTGQYIRLQIKQFDAAMLDLNDYMDNHPVDHLLRTHAFAALGQQKQAYIELDFCKQFREVKIVYDTACLLSERYSINGLPKTGLPNEVLDQQIQTKELEALTLLA